MKRYKVNYDFIDGRSHERRIKDGIIESDKPLTEREFINILYKTRNSYMDTIIINYVEVMKMKAILVSKSPSICADVLNGNANMLEFKNFPKDYVGWVYVYCTKDSNNKETLRYWSNWNKYTMRNKKDRYEHETILNGKVVCRFWCDYVIDFEEYFNMPFAIYKSKEKGFGTHISKLEIFDKPKELSEFYCNYTHNDLKKGVKTNYIKAPNILMKQLTKAPSNYCYVEVEKV